MTIHKFSLILKSGIPAARKIVVIKLVRSITGLGLKEAKDAVDCIMDYGAAYMELAKDITIHAAFYAREFWRNEEYRGAAPGLAKLLEVRDSDNREVNIVESHFGNWLVTESLTNTTYEVPKVYNCAALWRKELDVRAKYLPVIIGAPKGVKGPERRKVPQAVTPDEPAAPAAKHPATPPAHTHVHNDKCSHSAGAEPRKEHQPRADHIDHGPPPKGIVAPSQGVSALDVDNLDETDITLLVMAWTRKHQKYENIAAHFTREVFLKKNHGSNGR